jgi:hypothetical protein
VNIGEYTPIATDTQHYVTIEENLPGPNNSPGGGTRINVTFNIPAAKVSHYYEGQQLSPQQTNELIDSE